MWVEGNATVRNTLVTDNYAEGSGGGIAASPESIVISDSLITANRTRGEGGGFSGHSLTLYDSTISANEAGWGAGLSLTGSGRAQISTIVGSTISGKRPAVRRGRWDPYLDPF